MNDEQAPLIFRSRAEMLAAFGASNTKEADDRFYEDNDCGAELVFTHAGVDVVLDVVDAAGGLIRLWTHRMRYPIAESELLDTVDRLDRMFELAADARGLSRDALHDLTERAKQGGRRDAP